MRNLFLSSAAAILLGMGVGATPSAALPIGPVQAEAATALVEVQSRSKAKRGKSMRRSMMRGRRISRGGDPNARDPSRPPGAQNTGQTTGGPRY